MLARRVAAAPPHFAPQFDIAIVGAGFYGCRSALQLANLGLKVLLLEAEAAPCSRASRYNQARVHNGYHYPRSLLTALGSHRNYARFCTEFAGCLLPKWRHLYAIANQNSKLNASQFVRFCAQLGLPLSSPSQAEAALFDKHRIEASFVVEETALNTALLGQQLAAQVRAHPKVTLAFGTTVTRIEMGATAGVLHTSNGTFRAQHILAAAYGGLNALMQASNLPFLPLKIELAELALVTRPPALQNYGFTIMDGPFFSLMPYLPNGTCTLSHVRYTPRTTLTEAAHRNALQQATAAAPLAGQGFAYMRNDASRYVPSLRNLHCVGGFIEAKVVPLKNELDDGRPILLRECVGVLGGKLGGNGPSFSALLGSKLDSIYEWEAVLAERFGTCTKPT